MNIEGVFNLIKNNAKTILKTLIDINSRKGINMSLKPIKNRHALRQGYTTGSCAAGAAKAACKLLKNRISEKTVKISLPDGSSLLIPIKDCSSTSGNAIATVIKNAGDDPDVTHNLEIKAVVQLLSSNGDVHISGGKGVGKVTKKGLAISPGESAINPVPLKMITAAVRDVFPHEEVKVTIEVPKGEEIAKRTLNERLGITGGISILGTTGIVRPMSEEAFKTSILPELDQAVAYNYKSIILTPGNYGFKVAVHKIGVPQEAIVQMSNFVGYLLEEAAHRDIKQIILLGHIGKLIKVAGGIFHTHNRVADARLEILIANAAILGFPHDLLRDLYEFPTIEGAVLELKRLGKQSLLNELASKVSTRAQTYIHNSVSVGTILTLLNGEIIGWDKNAYNIIKNENWTWPF